MKLNKRVQERKQYGLVVDIDETIANTSYFWFQKLIEKFGSVEKLNALQMYRKYHYTYNVAYYQTQEVESWMEELRRSNKVQEELPVIQDANKTLQEIAKIIPIRAYLTARPEDVRDGTQAWLQKNNFPDVEVIMRPSNTSHREGNSWKAKKLVELYPKVSGIIDDNESFVSCLDDNYKGVVFLYNSKEYNINNNIEIISCESWQEVFRKVSKRFFE